MDAEEQNMTQYIQKFKRKDKNVDDRRIETKQTHVEVVGMTHVRQEFIVVLSFRFFNKISVFDMSRQNICKDVICIRFHHAIQSSRIRTNSLIESNVR